MEKDNNINDATENLPAQAAPSDNTTSEKAPSENTATENVQGKKAKGKRKKRFNIFNPFKNLYKQTKSDEEKKEKTVLFGWLAILFSFICIGLSYPCVWLGIKGVIFAFTHYLGPLTMLLGVGNIIIAALSIGVVFIPYYFWFQGIYLVIFQLCLNRRFISWFALLIWIVSVVGIFVFSIDSFSVIVGGGHIIGG